MKCGKMDDENVNEALTKMIKISTSQSAIDIWKIHNKVSLRVISSHKVSSEVSEVSEAQNVCASV